MLWKLLSLVLSSMLLCGCVVPSTSYQQNLIPIRCEVQIPLAPDLLRDKSLQTLKENYVKILIYAEELEKTLLFCVKGMK